MPPTWGTTNALNDETCVDPVRCVVHGGVDVDWVVADLATIGTGIEEAMGVTREKYKRLTDLFVVGQVLQLPDGDVMWVQALNPWEKNEAVMDGQTARSRTSLALNDPESREHIRLRAKFEEYGQEACIEEMLEARKGNLITRCALQMRGEEDWKDRIMVIERAGDLSTESTTEEEDAVLKAASDYAAELQERLNDRLDSDRYQLKALSEPDLWGEFKETYIESVGGTAAMAEYRLAEISYAARACDATNSGDGLWDHSECDNHTVRIFESKDVVKGLPEQLLGLLIGAVIDVSVSEVEAKNSDRQQGSSQSSPLPNEVEASTASTQTVTLPEPPTTL